MTKDMNAVKYARSATIEEVPANVIDCLRVRVLDTLAAITAGYHVETTDVTRQFVAANFRGDNAVILDGTGDRLGITGAALLNATAGNALDIDDGHRLVKGHPAAVVIPPALAAAEAADASVTELLNAVLVGYEIGVRAGLAIHELDGIYTGTGSWGAIGAAAAVARLRKCSENETAHALGVAEYHAPRTPIMRDVAHPGMTKDGIGWGAYTGTMAVLLAEHGFTGSGTVFDEPAIDQTSTFGKQYHVEESYLKPYPCCRWAQPGVDAALQLRAQHDISPDAIDEIHIYTFDEATHLQTRTPETPEHAEYSYPYPVSAALVCGQFTPDELTAETRTDPRILELVESVRLHRDNDLDDRFPSECLARIEIVTDLDTYSSEITRPRGANERPLPDKAIEEKVRGLLTIDFSEASVNTIINTLTDLSCPVSCLLDPWHT